MKIYEVRKKNFGSGNLVGEKPVFHLCANMREVYVLADERKRAGTFARQRGRNETDSRARDRAAFRASGALLSELFGGIEREPVQVELSQVRFLFELLRFLLKCENSCTGIRLTRRGIYIYNV
jgi:hypothetical protein